MQIGSPRRARRPRRFVVCGNGPLAYRLVSELVTRFGGDVTVVVPDRTENWSPQLGRLPGVRLLEAVALDDTVLRAAGVADARALALVAQDDVRNIHAALRAHDINPDLRLVVRMFNMSLGHRIRTLFTDCAVLSDSAMAAPSFVAAALGELAPNHVRLPGRTLYVARRDEVPGRRIVCGIADTSGGGANLLPADQDGADVVLVLADGAPVDPFDAHRGSRLSSVFARIRFLLGKGLVRIALTLLAVIVVGLVLLATVGRAGFGGALYQTLLDAAGDAVPDNSLSLFQKVVQLAVTLAGLAVIPVSTAVVVDGLVRARLEEPPARAARDHVVVVGLGNVGTRVVAQLHDLGIEVVCVERSEDARGVQMARRLGVPVVFGDATREDTLRSASVDHSRALLLLTSSDVVNLEAALLGRAQREDLRVVLRVFDDDLAQRIERVLGIAISRSVSRLAASAFAAAMVERQVFDTVSIGRAVLMIAEVPIVPESPLADQPVSAAHEQGEARVIALQRRGSTELDWTPSPTHVLARDDRLVVVATRAGLGRLLARSMSAAPAVDAG